MSTMTKAIKEISELLGFKLRKEHYSSQVVDGRMYVTGPRLSWMLMVRNRLRNRSPSQRRKEGDSNHFSQLYKIKCFNPRCNEVINEGEHFHSKECYISYLRENQPKIYEAFYASEAV